MPQMDEKSDSEHSDSESEQSSKSGGKVVKSRRGKGGKSAPQKKCGGAGKSCVHFHTHYKGKKRCKVPANESCVHFHSKGRKSRSRKSRSRRRH